MTVVFSGIRGIAFSPLDFILNPILWHDLVIKYRADATTAPNFSYGLLIKRLLQRKKPFMTWSFINRITSGGEPVDPAVMEQVTSVLAVPRSAIYIGYGLAEVALVVRLTPYFVADGLVGIAGGDGGGEGPSKIRIVNEGKEAVQDGTVGEIYVQSPSQVALGYWGKPEETINTFHNRIEGEEGEWLATGDLGKIVDDKLYVTGRKKEVIIINGVNYYPVDIERTVEKAYSSILRPGCTVAFQHSDGAIGLVAEVRKGVKKEHRPTPLEIVNLVTQANRTSVGSVCFLHEHTVPKTTSGKLKRVEVREIAIARAWPKGKVILEWHSPRTNDGDVVKSCAALPYFDPVDLKRLPSVIVVGGGATGLICALKLAERGIKVTVIEKNAMVDGHTRHAEDLGGHLSNPAFGVFSDVAYPNFVSLIGDLRVDKVRLCKGVYGHRNIAFDGHQIPEPNRDEVLRFLKGMRSIYNSGGGGLETIGEYLDAHGYDEDFIIYFFLSKVFFAGLSIQEYLQVPLDLMAWWSISDAFQADTNIFRLRNKDYMEAFATKLKAHGVEIVTSVSPQLLTRDRNGLSISLADDSRKTVAADKLVLAIPPNAAVEFLGKHLTADEWTLKGFDCRTETVVIHQDPKWAPQASAGIVFNLMPDQSEPLPLRDETIPMTTRTVSGKIPSSYHQHTVFLASHFTVFQIMTETPKSFQLMLTPTTMISVLTAIRNTWRLLTSESPARLLSSANYSRCAKARTTHTLPEGGRED